MALFTCYSKNYSSFLFPFKIKLDSYYSVCNKWGYFVNMYEYLNVHC